MTTVLLVEDEPAIAGTIEYALRSEGLRVRWTTTGREALVLAGEADLVLLDVGLPDANGFDVCRELRRRSDVPVVFLTARSEEVDRVVGLEIGADDYVAKPFSPRELAARVKAVLRRCRGDRERAGGGVAGFQVDPRRLAISWRGRELTLTRAQYRILAALIESPGTVFSRSRLLDIAWDRPDAAFERTVDSHIKDLRARLRAIDPQADPIRTHRGEGYALEPAP